MCASCRRCSAISPSAVGSSRQRSASDLEPAAVGLIGADVVINVGNKLQHNGAAPIVPRGAKFIDMRIDYASMGNVMLTEVPLVCDVGYGLDDLIAAVEQLMTSALRQKAADRACDVRKFSDWAKAARAQVVNNPDWNQSPIIADRLTWEVAQFADPDAIIVHEAGSVTPHSFDFNPIGGRELFYSNAFVTQCSTANRRPCRPGATRSRRRTSGSYGFMSAAADSSA
jgi:thiamine pyrophosphate-dependent acetolactate synthase large subunit-like protein